MDPASSITIRLPASPEAPRIARARVAHALADTPVVDEACLIVSELVTNAVVHGNSEQIEVAVRIFDAIGRIEVWTEGRNPSPIIPVDQGSRSGGFGLLIVDKLSDRWGVDQRSTVWSELSLGTLPR